MQENNEENITDINSVSAESITTEPQAPEPNNNNTEEASNTPEEPSANSEKSTKEKEGSQPQQDPSVANVTAEIARNHKPDLVAKRYTLKLDQSLPEFRSEFAAAFAVTDKSDKDNTELYCLVFDQEAPIRLNTINTLQALSHTNFITPIASEIAYISTLNEYRFVVILSKPKGITLAEYIENPKSKAEEFIHSTLIAKCAPVLEQINNLQISHGRINPKNLYIDPTTNQITIGECVSCPPGYDQPMLYETADRAMNIPLGKGEGEISADYYALGVVALFVQLGKVLEERYEDDSIIQEKLIKGTFNALLKNYELSPSMTDLYRGLLNDKSTMRWNGSQVRDWLKGKYFNLVRISPPIEATRSIMFNDLQYFSLEALAYALYRHWNISKKFLREDKLTKWVEGSVGNPELADKLRSVQKTTIIPRQFGSVFDNDDELVICTLHLLNPYGPFQFRNISINLNAFGTVLSHAFSQKKTETIQILGMAFSHHLYGYLEAHSEKNSNSKLIWHLKNAMEFIPKTGLGFGIERCLYELNPNLHCISPLVTSDYALTVPQLVEILNGKCDKQDTYPMDRHIAAFVASRLNVRNEIKIKGLSRHPKFSTNKYIQAAYILNLAQKDSGLKKLTGLTQALAKNLTSIAEMLHGKVHKKDFVDNINKVAKEGNVTSLYKTASDHYFILSDLQGFDEAKKKYLNLHIQLTKLKGNNTIANLGYHYGLRLSVVIAYVLCGLEFVYFVVR